MKKFMKMADSRNTSIHENISHWLVSVSISDDFDQLQYFLHINTMTANGIQSSSLMYRNEEHRNNDHAEFIDWIIRMK